VKFPLPLRVLAVLSLFVGCSLSAWCANPADSSTSDRTGVQPVDSGTPASTDQVTIPGPLRSFLRMAGISQKVQPEEVLPLLSRNIFAQGYVGASRPTEFLLLLASYVQQARELTSLAGPDGAIHASNCDDARPLLKVLGYQAKGKCGQSDALLETSDPARAFLTIDSGFPLHDLELAIQGGKPFAYPFASTRVPVLFTERDWITASRKAENKDIRELVDVLFRDPSLARLYWAMAHLDPETRSVLRQSVGMQKLLVHAPVLDFYGSHISIRSGRVIVPGGTKTEPAWRDLVGAGPESPANFVPALLAKDKGWLAAYFDALSRVRESQQVYFTDNKRIKSFYEALRSVDTSSEATRGVFRPAPGLMVLVTLLQIDANGEPRIPGNLEIWRSILAQKRAGRDWSKRASRIKTPQQLVEALFAMSRLNTDVGPLQVYLTLSQLDIRRPPQQRLAPETITLLAKKFEDYSTQYWIFSEFPELNDSSIALFLNVASSLDNIPNNSLRGNALGTFQASVGIWQILARQGQITTAAMNDSWQRAIKPFAGVRSSAQVFDAGRASFGTILSAASGKSDISQDAMIELLAGPEQSTPEAKRMHQEVANRMHTIMDNQRLVALDTLFALGSGLNEMAKGKPADPNLIRLSGELREFEMPRPIFSRSERTEWAAGIYNNRHTDLQMRTNLARIMKSQPTPAQLEEARGQLTSFLRDTLVGLNYAYYEPPGAQVLYHNPLFVRQHDFAAETVVGIERVWQAPRLFGAGSPAGGGAHLVGSLADLPYVLAQLEQDFIAPQNVQALIFRELVPGLLTSAVLPRWWEVSDNELHAVALYQRSGEELLTASAKDEELRKKVMQILGERMSPQMVDEIERGLMNGQTAQMLRRVTPADNFYLSGEFRSKYSDEANKWGAASQELQDLIRQHPDETSRERISRDFGVPHPVLTQTYGRELLNVEPLPPFSGYYSRLLAESWDSGNLYWARLADETGQSPTSLHRLVPDLTHRMIERIFATEFEDWPAILRAMRETGDDFRQGKITNGVQASNTVP
jgi:hypothetical protein